MENLKTLVRLTDEKQKKTLDEVAAEIVEKHKLGERSAEYLVDELGPRGFKGINVGADAQEIVMQHKAAAAKPEKTVTEPKVTQSKPRRRSTV